MNNETSYHLTEMKLKLNNWEMKTVFWTPINEQYCKQKHHLEKKKKKKKQHMYMYYC